MPEDNNTPRHLITIEPTLSQTITICRQEFISDQQNQSSQFLTNQRDNLDKSLSDKRQYSFIKTSYPHFHQALKQDSTLAIDDSNNKITIDSHNARSSLIWQGLFEYSAEETAIKPDFAEGALPAIVYKDRAKNGALVSSTDIIHSKEGNKDCFDMVLLSGKSTVIQPHGSDQEDQEVSYVQPVLEIEYKGYKINIAGQDNGEISVELLDTDKQKVTNANLVSALLTDVEISYQTYREEGTTIKLQSHSGAEQRLPILGLMTTQTLRDSEGEEEEVELPMASEEVNITSSFIGHRQFASPSKSNSSHSSGSPEQEESIISQDDALVEGYEETKGGEKSNDSPRNSDQIGVYSTLTPRTDGTYNFVVNFNIDAIKDSPDPNHALFAYFEIAGITTSILCDKNGNITKKFAQLIDGKEYVYPDLKQDLSNIADVLTTGFEDIAQADKDYITIVGSINKDKAESIAEILRNKLYIDYQVQGSQIQPIVATNQQLAQINDFITEISEQEAIKLGHNPKATNESDLTGSKEDKESPRTSPASPTSESAAQEGGAGCRQS